MISSMVEHLWFQPKSPKLMRVVVDNIATRTDRDRFDVV